MNTPLILLSGLLCDKTVWKYQLKHFEGDRRVIAIDFREFDDITQMAQSVLDLAPDRFALAGHSMGARVALEVHRVAAERVERLALLDTGTHGVKEGEPASRQVLVDLAESHGMAALAQKWLPPMLHPDHLADESIVGPLREMVLRMSPQIYRQQVQALLNRRDATSQLSDIRCPTLLGVGRQDAWSTLAQHESMASKIPGSILRVFEHSGHMAPFEAHSQVTATLEAWLQ